MPEIDTLYKNHIGTSPEPDRRIGEALLAVAMVEALPSGRADIRLSTGGRLVVIRMKDGSALFRFVKGESVSNEISESAAAKLLAAAAQPKELLP